MIFNKQKLFSTVGLMMAITLCGKVMGIMRDSMQAMYYGTYSAEAIAFTQAAFLPRNFLDIMFASVFSASFIPVFNRYLETKGQEAAFDLAARFIKLLLLVTVAVTIFAIVFAEPIYSIFLDAEAQAPEVRPLGIRLLRIMFPIMVISSLAFSLTGILQSLGQFNIPAAMSIASNGVILLYYFLFIGYFGVYGLAVAFVVGWSAQVLIQIPFLLKRGFFKRRQDFTHEGALKEIGRLSLPVMVASWLAPVNLLVNTRASGNLYGGEHGFPALIYANNLYTVITGLFVLSLANVLFPTLSKLAAREDFTGFAEFMQSCLRGMLFLLLPMTFGLMAIAEPLVSLVYQRGRFDEISVEITAIALFFFSIGIVGFGLQVILSRACFALQDGRGPLVTALVAMLINFVLSFTLAPSMEIGGPALASAVAITVAGVALLFRLMKRLPQSIWTFNMSVNIAKMLFLAVLMYAAVSFVLDALTLDSQILSLVIPAGFGAFIYIIGALLLGIPEAKEVFTFARKIRKT